VVISWRTKRWCRVLRSLELVSSVAQGLCADLEAP
jgi:hypothetical protein